MKISQFQKVEIKGEASTRWMECVATEDFDTGDQRWKLMNVEDGHCFQPLRDKCKIRIIEKDGNKKLVKFKKDSEIWDVIKAQIDRSKIKRYPWNLVFGESLSKTILRHKMKGLSHHETYQVIIEDPMLQKLIQFFPEHKERIEEKIKISVSARYGENDTALNLYDKEFRKK